MSANQDWKDAYDGLRAAVISLGFPEELAVAISRNLGRPKAMRRMTSWLYLAKPARAELVVDEMLAIREEIRPGKQRRPVRRRTWLITSSCITVLKQMRTVRRKGETLND